MQLLIALALLASSGLASETPGYPLKCRGGGKMKIERGKDQVKVHFDWAKGKADDGLKPGQCSWLDRAMRTGEPSVVCDSAARTDEYKRALRNKSGEHTFIVNNDNHGCMLVASE